MWIAVINNLPEMILGGAWTGLMLYAGYRVGKWRSNRNSNAA